MEDLSKLWIRWAFAVTLSSAAFVACWAILQVGAGVQTRVALGWAILPFSVVLPLSGLWPDKVRKAEGRTSVTLDPGGGGHGGRISLVAVAPAHLAVVAAVAVAVAVAAGAEAVTEVAAALRAAAAVLVVPVGSAVAEAVTEVTGWSGSPTRWRVRMSDMSLFFFRIARLRVQGAKWQSADSCAAVPGLRRVTADPQLLAHASNL